MSEEYDCASYAVAIRLQQAVADENAAVVVGACCWVLASLAIQASRQGDCSVDQALRATTDQLIACTARLAADGVQESDRIQ